MEHTTRPLFAFATAALLLAGCSSTQDVSQVQDDVYYDASDAPIIAAAITDESTTAPAQEDDYYDPQEAQAAQRYNDVVYNDPHYYNYSRFGFSSGFYGGNMMGSSMYYGTGFGSSPYGGGFYNDPFYSGSSFYGYGDPFTGYGSPYYGNGWSMGMGYGYSPYGYSPYGGGYYCPQNSYYGGSYDGGSVYYGPRPKMNGLGITGPSSGTRSMPTVGGRDQIDLMRTPPQSVRTPELQRSRSDQVRPNIFQGSTNGDGSSGGRISTSPSRSSGSSPSRSSGGSSPSRSNGGRR